MKAIGKNIIIMQGNLWIQTTRIMISLRLILWLSNLAISEQFQSNYQQKVSKLTHFLCRRQAGYI